MATSRLVLIYAYVEQVGCLGTKVTDGYECWEQNPSPLKRASALSHWAISQLQFFIWYPLHDSNFLYMFGNSIYYVILLDSKQAKVIQKLYHKIF